MPQTAKAGSAARTDQYAPLGTERQNTIRELNVWGLSSENGWQRIESGRGRRLRLAAALATGLAAAAALALAASRGAPGSTRGLRRSRAAQAVELDVDEDCHTAAHGERCHADVVYAMRNRALHPEWYIGLDNCSTFGDFQAFMHTQVLNSGARRCPKPCAGAHEVGHTSPHCKKEKSKKKCHTAVPGDQCYAHVLYTKKEATKYPRWYPGLSAESSLVEVQHYLKEENVCPEPCELVEEKNVSKELKGCHTALPGETCFGDVMLAKEHFIEKHPEWYPGLTNESSRDEFQAFLHAQHHADADAAKKACPNPCNEAVVDETTLRATCETAELSDACYESVVWGATEGMANHPEWYPDLADNSTFEDFQLHVHGDNHTKCHHVPCPCHTAVRGEKCYWSILWVLRTGIDKYPKTFKGLSTKSSLQEVQLHLHKDRSSECGRPCATFDADERSPWKSTFLEESDSLIRK